MRLDISELTNDFPDFRVAVVRSEGLVIPPSRDDALALWIAEREAETRRVFAGTELSEIAGVAAWRRAYKAFGIKKTSYRSSVERLVKNVLADRTLPSINAFVDAYNGVSLAHVLPVGADDLDRVEGDIAFRYSRPGDSFLDMSGGEDGGGEPADDPPKAGEVVYADGAKVLCRRWNWRQDARSLVTPETRRAVVTLQSNGFGDVGAAAKELAGLLERVCGARSAIAVADRLHPLVDIG